MCCGLTSVLLGVQIRTDGSGLHKVFDSHGGLANHPHFSPDRGSVVFTSDFAGTIPPLYLSTHPFGRAPCPTGDAHDRECCE